MRSAPPPAPAPAGDLEQVSSVFAAALSAGDAETAAACFTRDACLLTADRTAVHGRDAIRPVLGQLIAMDVLAEVQRRSFVIAGVVALAADTWHIRLGSRAAGGYQSSSTSMTVLRRAEEVWKLQVCAPWGWISGPTAQP